VGQGFAVEVACQWQDPHTHAVVPWTERRLVVQSAAHARTQHARLHERLAKAQAALSALNAKPASDRAEVETRAQAMVTRYRVTDYLGLSCRERVTCHTRSVGRGRPGPRRPPQMRETHTWTICVHRRPAALARFERVAGEGAAGKGPGRSEGGAVMVPRGVQALPYAERRLTAPGCDRTKKTWQTVNRGSVYNE
jgi:hypothetical protein